jgi:hypothetical protein
MISQPLNEQRDTMRRLMGSILGERVYICFASEIGLTPHADLGGLAAPGLTKLIEERMPDEFVEPRPAIAVVDDPLLCGSQHRPGAVTWAFGGVAIHEFAHVVASGITAESVTAIDGEILPDLVKTVPSSWPAHAGPIRWLGHDCRFIRALCHLHHRAKARGHFIPPAFSFNHEYYTLPPLTEFLAALGGEPEDMALHPIREVMTTPAPSEFQRIWTDIVVRSLQGLSEGKMNECDS